MSAKKIILVSVVLTILFFIIGGLITPWFTNYMIHYFAAIAQTDIIVSTVRDIRIRMLILTTISLALVPVLVMCVLLVIKKFKHRTIRNWDYFFHFAIVLSAYLFGAYCKFYAIRFTIEKVMNVKTDYKVDHIPLVLSYLRIYDWAFYASLLAAVLIVLSTKKRKARIL